ncbi:lysoplasmalogenase [Duganella fentianensis]|uniref:lysoplasmalogenase n=1 Tax=Duganella fentianensis TaxID=2692177 RepID=UPI0032B23B8B
MPVSRLYQSVIAASVALAILGSTLGGDAIWLHYVAKPLATLLIAGLVWRHHTPQHQAYRRALLAGLAFSWLGDVLLMLPKAVLALGFELGLAAFLLAHLCFLRALTRDARWARPLWPLLLLLLIGSANLAVLWPGIAPALRPPVLAYMLCLVAMAAQAITRARSLATPASTLAAIGGLLFLSSDTLLAYNKFHSPLPASALLVLGSYYAALYLLARSLPAASGALPSDLTSSSST